MKKMNDPKKKQMKPTNTYPTVEYNHLKETADGVKRAAYGAKCSVDGSKRSTYGAKRSAESSKRSAYGAKRSTDGTKRSADGSKETADNSKRSAYGAKDSFTTPAEAFEVHVSASKPSAIPFGMSESAFETNESAFI